MKYFLLLGGFCGFLTVFIGGLVVGNDLATVLRNACLGCVAAAFLMRGFRVLLAHQARQIPHQQAAMKATASTAAAR